MFARDTLIIPVLWLQTESGLNRREVFLRIYNEVVGI